MGKWLAGIASGVIVGVIVWLITGDGPTGTQPGDSKSRPSLRVTAWYAPEAVQIGKAMEISVKTLAPDDTPVSGASVKLTPVAGTFLWAAAGGPPIEGETNRHGVFSTKFQTVALVSPIGGPPPANSRTGRISILAAKMGYADGRTELDVVAANR